MTSFGDGRVDLQVAEEACFERDVSGLVQAHARLLFRVAHSILRNSAEAEDVVQDTFLRVIEHRDSLPAIRNLRVWLVRIAWNLALDRRRRARPSQADPAFLASLVSPDLPADRALAESQQLSAALGAIDRLPSAERQILLLAALEELSTVEIAGVLGRSDSAVRALLFRARSRLRTRLAPERGTR